MLLRAGQCCITWRHRHQHNAVLWDHRWIDTNTGYPQMISKILHGISNIFMGQSGVKMWELVVCRLQARCWGRPANDNISQVSIEAAEAGEGNVIKFYSRIIFIQLQSSRGRHVVIITPRSKLQTALYLCIVLV